MAPTNKDHTTSDPRTAAERFFVDQQTDPEYKRAYRLARRRVDAVDAIRRAVERQRVEAGMSKEELARRAGLTSSLVRRVLTAERSNPTLETVLALTEAMGLTLVVVPDEDTVVSGISAQDKTTPAELVSEPADDGVVSVS